jgi:hypothetical protein
MSVWGRGGGLCSSDYVHMWLSLGSGTAAVRLCFLSFLPPWVTVVYIL